MKTKLTLCLILLAALFLRLYQLDRLPISLFGDEVDASYHAWSLATTMRDYYGQFLPTYIHSLSEWRAPLLMYVIAPFVGILGPSTFSARLPMALLGVGSIYLIYLIAGRLFPNSKRIGLLATFLLAITPLHLHYTRNAVEQPPLFFLELLGIYLYLRLFQKPSKLPFAFIPFALTFYTYSISNLATPTIVLLLFIFFPPKYTQLTKPLTLAKFLSVGLICLPIAYHLLFGHAAGRFKLISIFNDQKLVDQVVTDRTKPWVEAPAERVFNNKFTAVAGEFVSNYLHALSPQFLFLSGDPNFRQQVDRFGSLLLFAAPLFLLGLVHVISKKTSGGYFALSLLLTLPIGSALTQSGGDHASRLFLLLLPTTLIAALGLDHLLQDKKKIIGGIFIFSLVLNFASFWYRYTTHYKNESSHVWQFGYEPLFKVASKYFSTAKRVFINNTAEPALYRFGFFTPFPPALFQKSFSTDVPVVNLFPGFDGFSFGDKYYFGQAKSFESMVSLIQSGDIYLAAQGREVPGDWNLQKDPPKGIKVLATIYDPYQRPLFYVLTK